MNNKKTTKRALLSSVMAIVLCLAMLIGTTFAWFTDSASTAVNKIQAGNLEIELQMKDNNGNWVNAEGKTLPFLVEGKIPAKGTQILWEPGCTYYVPEVRVVNKGNLAVKIEYVNELLGVTGKLAEVLEPVFKTPVDANGEEVNIEPEILKPSEASPAWSFGYHMLETAGNEYQNATATGMCLIVVATQATYENDSFNNQYDKDATYPVVVSQNELNTSLTLDALKDENGKVSPVEVTLGDTVAEDIDYNQNNSGYTGKGVMLGSTNLNKYAATPAVAGEYKFTFKDGTITSTATGYGSIDNYKDTSVYMLVPGNSDVVFENMTFNGVVSFDIQKYTSPWSNLNSISFKNCIFNGIIIGTCPASNVTFDGCTFNAYTNATSANNSNPIWWREDTEGSGANANPIETFTFVNNKVIGTRPVKIERIGKTVSPIFTIKNNSFDISAQAGDTVTKNMAINIGMGENPNLPFTLIDEGNTISANTAALYTASLTGGSNWYKEIPGMKVLDGNGNNKVITALVWKTTTGETFELKTVG